MRSVRQEPQFAAVLARHAINDGQPQAAAALCLIVATLQERMKAADADNDGLIDRAEAQAKLPRLAKRFDTLDVDDDGKLSHDELRAAGQKMAERHRR